MSDDVRVRSLRTGDTFTLTTDKTGVARFTLAPGVYVARPAVLAADGNLKCGALTSSPRARVRPHRTTSIEVLCEDP